MGENKAETSLRKSDRPKKEKVPVDFYGTCHFCKKYDSTSAMIVCSNDLCKVPFCYSCVKKIMGNTYESQDQLNRLRNSIEERLNWVCFVCNQSCICKICKKDTTVTENESKSKAIGNIITIPNLNFQVLPQAQFQTQAAPTENVVKIEDFVIYEQQGPENESDVEEGISNSHNQNSSSAQIQQTKNESQKMKNIVQNVEELAYKPNVSRNILRKCVSCDRSDLFITELLKFKQIEEFIVYFKYIFEMRAGSIITDADSFEKNRQLFTSLTNDINKIIKQSLKNVKYLCKHCLFSKLNENDGIYHIYRALEIHNILESYQESIKKDFQTIQNSISLGLNLDNKSGNVNSCSSNPHMTMGQSTPSQNQKVKNEENLMMTQNSENLKHPKIEDFVPGTNQHSQEMDPLSMILGSSGFNMPTNSPGSSQILQQLMDGQANFNPQMNLPNSSMLNSLSPNNLMSNFSKIVEGISSFNNKNLTHNQNLVNNVTQLTGVLSNYLENEAGQEQEQNDSEKKDDGMNVTNIIMNFDNAQKNPVLTYMMNVLDELKKQIVSIQYYSLLQKFFISYIFKNLEVFMDQVGSGNNQASAIGEFSKNMQNAFSGMNMPNLPQGLSGSGMNHMAMLASLNSSVSGLQGQNQGPSKSLMDNLFSGLNGQMNQTNNTPGSAPFQMGQMQNLADLVKKMTGEDEGANNNSSKQKEREKERDRENIPNPMDIIKNLNHQQAQQMSKHNQSGMNLQNMQNIQNMQNMQNLQNIPGLNQLNQSQNHMKQQMMSNISLINQNQNPNANALLEQLLKRNNPNQPNQERMNIPPVQGSQNMQQTMQNIMAGNPFGGANSFGMSNNPLQNPQQNNLRNQFGGQNPNLPMNFNPVSNPNNMNPNLMMSDMNFNNLMLLNSIQGGQGGNNPMMNLSGLNPGVNQGNFPGMASNNSGLPPQLSQMLQNNMMSSMKQNSSMPNLSGLTNMHNPNSGQFGQGLPMSNLYAMMGGQQQENNNNNQVNFPGMGQPDLGFNLPNLPNIQNLQNIQGMPGFGNFGSSNPLQGQQGANMNMGGINQNMNMSNEFLQMMMKQQMQRQGKNKNN